MSFQSHRSSAGKFFCTLLTASVLFSTAVAFAEPVTTGNPLQSEENISNKQPDFSGWKTASTEHFKFVYEDAYRPVAERYAYFADEAWYKIAQIYSKPQDRTEVFVTARTNTVNAYTFFVPPEIGMFNTPVATPLFGFRDSWEKTFFTHELVHLANITFEDKSYIGSKLFGNYVKGMDYSSVPGWAMEGLTTVLETALTNGGRGRSPYFEMEYKAPTLDNGFISYSDIGLEEEPPYGQAYVMGYLIMRSIADRWGYSALADIERNRSLGTSWEDSVKLVTGERAEDIYKDVRIALAKKYSKERTIPEGKIISSRDVGTFYYKPAIVMDDGTLIGLRFAQGMRAAAVRLDPSARDGSAYLQQTNPEVDLNTVPKETILFEADFSDETSLTCDSNGKIYASISSYRADRKPGFECFNDIYSWTEDEGLVQITDSGCVFQPSVSRDGSTLVAVEHHGLKMRLISIDTETLKKQVVLESDSYDFIQPAVNDDGTKIAFLALDEQRARVCFIEKGDSNFIVVANGEGAIYDPAYPSWNSDGKLTYACNYRGRLEVFEIEQTEFTGMDDEDDFVHVPVVADPIGATWAYKTERGIYYSSHASTGDVIKMKPLSEWGIVPSFEGPSLSGKTICFGDLEVDYPDFEPYFIPSEVEVEKDNGASETAGSPSAESIASEQNSAGADGEETDGAESDGAESGEGTESDTDPIPAPIPVSGKYVMHRDPYYEETYSNLLSEYLSGEKEFQRELGPESLYIPGIRPTAYFPLAIMQTGFSGEYVWGAGYNMVFTTPRLQQNSGFGFADIYWWPQWQNVSGGFNIEFPISNTTLDIAANRMLNVDKSTGTELFVENNSLFLGITTPIYHRIFDQMEWDIQQIYQVSFSASRSSASVIPINSTMAYDMDSTLQAGVDLYWTDGDFMRTHCLNQTYMAIGGIKWNDFSFGAGVEGIVNYTLYGSMLSVEVEGGVRYLYAQKEGFKPQFSGLKYAGEIIDGTYPVNAVVKAGVIIPDFIFGTWHVNESVMVSAGKNSYTPSSGNPANFTLNPKLMTNVELDLLDTGRNKIQCGVSESFNLNTMEWTYEGLYVTVKYNWIRI